MGFGWARLDGARKGEVGMCSLLVFDPLFSGSFLFSFCYNSLSAKTADWDRFWIALLSANVFFIFGLLVLYSILLSSCTL